MVDRGLCLLILSSAGAWLRSLQRAESRSHTEELRSDDDEVVQPQRLPSCLLELNAIRRPEPLSIAEAMERLPIPAVVVRGEFSPNLAEIVCRVLANDSHGIIGGHLSVDSSLQGYRIGIEARVSSVRTTSAEGSSGEGLRRDAQKTSQATTRE